MNQLIGHPRVLCMEDSNYKWGVRKFNLYECGVCNPIIMKFILYIIFMSNSGK